MGIDRVQPSDLEPLRGHERFSFGPTVTEFRSWAMGDLRMNTVRGYLVELMVAKAVGSPSPARVEWAPFDVEAADGTRIEVKTTAFLQSWSQTRQSIPSWTFRSVGASSTWDEEVGANVAIDPAGRVDVWVFALQTCTEPAEYQPLDASQWNFRVVPHRQLLAAGQTSARISTFDRLGIHPVGYEQLGDTVRDARVVNESLGRQSS